MSRHFDDPGPPHGESGQTMVEYAVVLAVITAAIVVSIAALSSANTDMIQSLVDVL